MYDVVLFVHLVGVVLLVVAVATSAGEMVRAQRAETVQEVRSLASRSVATARLIGPAGALILGAGLYMVSRHGDDGAISWTSGWVDVSLGLFALLALLGRSVEEPHAKRVAAAARAVPDGPVPADLDVLRRNPVVTHVSVFGVAQLFSFLFLMSTKPAVTGSLVTVAVVGIVSAVAAQVVLRALPQPQREMAAPRSRRTSDDVPAVPGRWRADAPPTPR